MKGVYPPQNSGVEIAFLGLDVIVNVGSEVGDVCRHCWDLLHQTPEHS